MLNNFESYEVTCKMNNPEYKNTFKKYMIEKHIPDILNTKSFKHIYFVENEETNSFTISYLAESKKILDEYITVHAPNLREDFIKNMDIEQLSVSRRTVPCICFSK